VSKTVCLAEHLGLGRRKRGGRRNM